jgi:uncharacterized membrane protein YtjA (UPF0391 family)
MAPSAGPQTRGVRSWVCAPSASAEAQEAYMLRWALIFLILGLVAGALGLWGIAGAAAEIAKVLFFVFLFLFLIGLVSGLVGRGRHA